MGSEIVLSARMLGVAGMVTRGSRVCDVGCDHGFVSIYLLQQGISPRVLAMDVRWGPLSRAQEHIRQQGLEAYIETRLSDGVAALKVGEADTLICAGMGGRLMQRILEEGREKLWAMRELILQPQSEVPAFRTFLRRAGYVTVEENMIYEAGKYYPMMKVVPAPLNAYRCRHTDTAGVRSDRVFPAQGSEATGSTGAGYDSREAEEAEQEGSGSLQEQRLWDYFGRLLLQQRHPVLQQYLRFAGENNRQLLERLRSNGGTGGRTAKRIRELEEELQLIYLALEQYEESGKKDF